MSNKDLAVQSYEKKIVNTLREEKYELPSLKRNSEFLDSLSIVPDSKVSIANKFYKEQLKKLNDSYINDFSELLIPIVAEKGLSFDAPEEQIQQFIHKYDLKTAKIIEKLQMINRIHQEPFYNAKLISENWGLCLDGIENFPFMMALGCERVIILDETFNMDLYFFASLGAMPHISPIQKAGNIDLPPNTYSIDLQLMIGPEFKKISILLLKQKLPKLEAFFGFMVNIGLIVDTKIELEEDFSGLKWIKNSLQYSLFKRKEFLNLTKILKMGGLIIDKSVSPMQVQKIQSMMKNVNMNVGFDIHKLGTLQYSIIQKMENYDLIYDGFEDLICRMPEIISNKGNKFMTY